MTKSYETGYGKPPKHTQFQKGKSGNPDGRPRGKKSANLQQDLMDTLLTKIPFTVNGRQTKITYWQAIQQRLVTSAVNGKADAIKLIMSITKGEAPMKASDLDAAIEQGVRDEIARILEEVSGKTAGLPSQDIKTLEDEPENKEVK